MLAGELVTVPAPVPFFVTVRAKLCSVIAAATVVAAVMVTTHGLVPEHPPPLQPVKAEPVAGLAVSVTAVLESYRAEHLAPHVIPTGVPVTGPVPVPARVTVSAKLCGVHVARTVGR